MLGRIKSKIDHGFNRGEREQRIGLVPGFLPCDGVPIE